MDEVARRFLPEAPRSREHRRARRVVALSVATLALLAALWRLTPLEEWARPDALAGLAAPLRESAWGPWAFASGMALGGLVMLPVTAMIVAAALVFGPVEGFAVAWLGAMASALLGYGLGRVLWRDAVHRLMGRRLRRVSEVVGERGIVAVALLRLVPVAPYTAVNLAAGASHVGLRDYALGTLLAMTPGILALTVLADRVARAVRDPGPATFLIAAGVAAAAWLGLRLLRSQLRRREIQREG